VTTINENRSQFKQLVEKIKVGWTSLSTIKKVMMGSALGIAIVGFIVYGIFFSKANLAVLYADLDMVAAGEIRAELQARGEEHEIGEGGTAILVPESEVDRLRMELAVNGLTPESGVGFELFDDAPIGMSERDYQIMRQRALQGELQRSINSLAPVEDSRVHLNMSTDSIFARETAPSSASIRLSLRHNQTLTEDQVEGIMSLVSSAVNNLPVENITIIDESGVLLSRGVNGMGSLAASGEITERQLAYARELEGRVIAQLGKVFGHHNITASVNVNLDASSQVQRSEEYSDGADVSESTTIRREGGTAEDVEDGGPLDNNMGNQINLNDPDEVLNDSNVTDYDRTINRQPSVFEEERITPPGEINAISVAVIYNGELTPQLEDAIFDQVVAIAGADLERGDDIAIAGIPFQLQDWDDDITTSGILGNMTLSTILMIIGGLIAVLIIGLMIRRFIVNRQSYDDFEGTSVNELAPYLATELDDHENEKQATEDELNKEVDFNDELNLVDDELGLTSEIPVDETTKITDEEELWEAEGKDMIELSSTHEPQSEEVDLLTQVKEIFESQPDEAHGVLKMWINEKEVDVNENANYDVVLEGIEKAATLLIVLGKEITTNMLRLFNQEDMVHLVQTISNIRAVPRQQALSLMEEFLEILNTHYQAAEGGYHFAKAALAPVLDEEMAENVLRNTQNKRPFEFLHRVETKQLLKALINEHPQTIALVLCYLPSEKAAQITAELPTKLQSDVIQRIGLMKNTSPEVIETVESVIEERLQSSVIEEMTNIGGIHTVADILNTVDRATQKNILETMEKTDHDFAEAVRSNLFTFEDIVRLDGKTIQRIIRDIEQATIALALKGATDSMINIFMTNISSRAAERLKEEIEYIGPVRLSEVEKAQQEIVNIIRKLEEQGEIIINHSGDQDVMV